MIAIYVDDMPFLSNNTEMLEKEKRAIAKEFQVEDLGELHYVFDMRIVEFITHEYSIIKIDSHQVLQVVVF